MDSNPKPVITLLKKARSIKVDSNILYLLCDNGVEAIDLSTSSKKYNWRF